MKVSSSSVSTPASDGIAATVHSRPQQSPLPPARPARAKEKGAGYFKPILWTFILLSLAYVGFKVIPVLIAEFEFQDSIQDIARQASANGGTVEKIRDAVQKEADKEDLPVNKEDIKVTGNHGNVRINVEYSVTVDLNVYQWTLVFHPAASNDSLV